MRLLLKIQPRVAFEIHHGFYSEIPEGVFGDSSVFTGFFQDYFLNRSRNSFWHSFWDSFNFFFLNFLRDSFWHSLNSSSRYFSWTHPKISWWVLCWNPAEVLFGICAAGVSSDTLILSTFKRFCWILLLFIFVIYPWWLTALPPRVRSWNPSKNIPEILQV